MSEKKITLEDIAFLITRLTDALEAFNKQANDTHNIIVADKPRIKRNQKEDDEIRRHLEFSARMARKQGASPERINQILNPTPSELDEQRLQHRKFKREIKQEEKRLIESEKRQISIIDNRKPLIFGDFKISEIKVDQLLIISYPYRSDHALGFVNEINNENIFPLIISDTKQDLSPAKKKIEVDNIGRIKAVVDPLKVKKNTTKHLILLAIKYEISFDGLIYLKLSDKK